MLAQPRGKDFTVRNRDVGVAPWMSEHHSNEKGATPRPLRENRGEAELEDLAGGS
jgi:hypothetical protein